MSVVSACRAAVVSGVCWEADDVSGTSVVTFTRPQLLVGADPHCDLQTIVRHTVY